MIRTSLQRLDPLSAIAGRRLTVIFAAAVLAFSIVFAIVPRPFVSEPAAHWVACALFAAAAVVLVVGALRSSGPIGGARCVWILALGALGMLASVVGVVDARVGSADWASYPLAILLLALIPYRPPLEMVIATGALAMWALVVITFASTAIDNPPIGYRQVAAAVPILAIGLGGIAFVGQVAGALGRWRRSALNMTTAEARRHETSIARAVQSARVDILNREVVPFFADLAARGDVTAEDAETARRLADSFRSLMVSELERSWLDELVMDAVHPHDVVSDPSSRAVAMKLDQRSALRALIAVLRDLADDAPSRLSITISDGEDVCDVSLVALLRVSERTARSTLGPYFAVMATVFSDLGFRIRANTLTLRFCYARP